MFKYKILIILLISNIANANDMESNYLIKLENKVYKNSLNIISEDNIVFKEIKSLDWENLSYREQNLNPIIMDQKENFLQNYEKITTQKKLDQYIYTNITKGIEFVKETKEERREITENLNRQITVLKINETESELKNCSNWNPLENTIVEGETFNQTRNCEYDLIEKYRYYDNENLIIEKDFLSIKNKEEERAAIGTLQVNKYCKIEIKNMAPISTYSAALGIISLQLMNGSDFNFGSLTTNTGTQAIFTNANIQSSSTYSNSTYYYVSYAIKGYQGSTNYWLGSNSTLQSYTITLNEGQNLKSITLSDKPTCNSSCRGAKAPYNINLYDCQNNLIKSYTVNNNLSGAYGTVGTLIFN